MQNPALSVLRAELLIALSANTDRLRDALRADLARPIDLDEGRHLQFEIDPFFGISSCATEEAILSDDWLDEALPKDWFERAEALAGGWNEMISQELCPWFAECWKAVDSPTRFSPAFLFFHGHHLQQFDLEHRRRLSSTEAFGK
jgi:hypothetical protein